MTELEYVIANFAERFAGFRGKKIVLHGSRNYAEAIIDNYANSFHFLGIMSLDPLENECFHGLKVLREDDLSALSVDIVILTERVKYAVEAFYAIRHTCGVNGIAVYNMYGLNEFLLHREAEDAEDMSLAEAKKLCVPYDMVAFEAMDTVLYSPALSSEISVRTLFYDLIVYLREQGKEIRFSLRKSFPSAVQIEALKKFGVLLDEKQEVVYREGEDLSFRQLREQNFSLKILYFGSGLANEFILPRCYGIDTCRFIGITNFDSLMPSKRVLQEKKPFLKDWKEQIKKDISEKTLISFDIFDTLLIRKVLYPKDVFLLTEVKAVSAGFDAKGFAAARTRSEKEQPFCDIDGIYKWLEDFFCWNATTTQAIKELEMDTEREVLAPRMEVVELLRFAQKSGKRIILTSDMYLPERDLCKILADNGISGFERIIVSCGVKKAKQSGLFGELLKICNEPDKILHIGDNPISDGVSCDSVGIKSCLIPSTLALAWERGWDIVIKKESTLMERCLLGLIISKLFQNPFQNPNFSEWKIEDLLNRLGFCVVGPLVTGYLTWLFEKLNEGSFEGVMFLARDGWLPYNIYKQIRSSLVLPMPIYYYANRRAAFLCCADSEDAERIVDTGKSFGVNVKETLQRVYQIANNDILPHMEYEGILDYIMKHLPKIHENAVRAKEGYLQYSEKCGMLPEALYAVIDFFALGKTQKYLSTFLPYKLKGFYFGNYMPSSPMDTDIEYYLHGANPLLFQRYIELEPFFSSPEPSQKCMTKDGIPVFAEELRSKQDIQEMEIVLKSAEEFSLEFFKLFYQEGQIIDPALIEEIYAVEDYYVAQHEAYDDWFGALIRKRNAGSVGK